MDRSWIRARRMTREYLDGLEIFLDIAFERVGRDGLMVCPCKKCVYGKWCQRAKIKEHLICDGLPPYGIHWESYGIDDNVQTFESNVGDVNDDDDVFILKLIFYYHIRYITYLYTNHI